MPNGQPRRSKIECERNSPKPKSLGGWHERGRQPKKCRAPMADEIARRKRPRVGHLTGAKVLCDEDEPHRRIRRCKTGRRAAVERIFGIGSHGGDREHLYQRESALDHVIGIEPRGKDRMACPRPPDEGEQRSEPHEPNYRVVVAQRLGDLGDGGHKNEIEEQLQPRNLTAGFAGRADSERCDERAHPAPTGSVQKSRTWHRMSEKDGRTNAREESHAPSMPGRPLQFRLLSRTRGEDCFDELFGYL